MSRERARGRSNGWKHVQVLRRFRTILVVYEEDRKALCKDGDSTIVVLFPFPSMAVENDHCYLLRPQTTTVEFNMML